MSAVLGSRGRTRSPSDVRPRDVDDDVARGRLPRALQGLGAGAARVLPVIDLDEQAVTDLGHGKRIAAPAGAGADGAIAALDGGGRLVAVVEPVEEGALPELAPVIWELPQLVLDEGFALLAINAQHSLLAGQWHARGKHPQPDAVDRCLLAQAQSEGLSVVSSDLALRGHGVPVVW